MKLDEVLKFLFSTSNKVLVKLLNGIFDEKFDVDEVELTVSNNEFVEDDLGILRGDMFFDILNKNHNKASYHIEFQTKNDNTMVIRMFEYGFKKGKEQLKNSKKFKEEIKTIYFPKQKVIFFEENKSIKNQLKLKIIFPDEQEIIYTVDVIKYWEYTDKELKEKLAKESAKLFEEDEILGEDFHKMLLAIQNLIEYLNRNYMKDENIENEVNKMTKTLYDPEVEKRGIEKGIKQGIKQGREQGIKSAIEKMLLKGMKEADVANILDTDISLVKEILKKIN